MATRTRRSQRRTEALSRERIVEAAIELLDAAGESGLTFRALTERLATGPGAIYWHVANKGELLGAATDAVVAAALAAEPAASAKSPEPAGPAGPAEATESAGPAESPEAAGPAESAGPAEAAGPAESAESPEAAGAAGAAGPAESAGSPQDGIRAIALGLFDAIEEHPWLASQLMTQLSHSLWETVAPRIFESVGRQIRALGVPESSWFAATSALMHYILGAAGQNATNAASARTLGPEVDRARFLDAASTAWEQLDPDDYPFTRAVAGQLRGHDDREQFLAGVDLILSGITASLPAR
ncbi:TetR/AcrR family transcriptional regulator C-terminal domain-containing protein [Streptomyces hygroscopicus]|uniref:TetR/AcrR family transcriptional regulator C-terminal domain-containing protein n=1 Tax=Streptomyces hygroscopicus TaxID=1912 RepID=UPI00078334BA|nr:TetR/AcrR family transcriptional regulator C-terminal domain-containing protein [Streptomyces hygroscopicus]